MKKRNDTPSSTERFVSVQYIRNDGTIETYNNYVVSDKGRVASLVDTHGNKRHVMKILKPQKGNLYGHLQIWLCVNGEKYLRTVHRTVLSSFNPELWSIDTNNVDHIDRNPANNHLDNLHWVSHNDNDANRNMGPLKQIRVTHLSDGHTELFDSMSDCSRAFGKSIQWCIMVIRQSNGFHKGLNILIEKIESE